MTQERSVIIASEAGISIRSLEDIGDAVGACFGTAGIIFTEQDLAPAFFDLRTRIAGELDLGGRATAPGSGQTP